MFEKYNPINNNIFRVINNDGIVIDDEFLPDINNKNLVKAYTDMLFARTADLQTVSYQRQGRIFTYPPNYGQEAIGVAAGAVMKKEDWLIPAFREMSAWLAKGVSLKEIFLYFMGNEIGTSFRNANNVLPISVPIASQLLHATGIGYEINYNKKKDVVFAFVGDGGTSEGDFHESLNFAGVWKTPVLFIVQNNQYAISTPFSLQTASDSIAIKSIAYGIKGIKVDGNDYLAMLSVMKHAADYSRKGKGPVLIEALTYRKGAHTTSDDPTKYRSQTEEKKWDKTDPLLRLKKYLINKNLWKENQDEKLIKQYKQEVDREFIEAENFGDYPLEDVFKHMYSEIPQDLKRQQLEHEKFLNWKEE